MQGLCEHINAGFGEVHDLHKVFKGEEVTVGIALMASMASSPQGTWGTTSSSQSL